MQRAIAWGLAVAVLAVVIVLLAIAATQQWDREPTEMFSEISVDCAAPYTATPAADAIMGWKCVK
jgi:hypothetical protein